MKNTMTAVILAALITCGCTENQRARNYGGSMTVKIEKGQKVVNATWKGADGTGNLWILTRPMRTNETAEVLVFQEKSTFGVMEGKVILKEESR